MINPLAYQYHYKSPVIVYCISTTMTDVYQCDYDNNGKGYNDGII